MQEWISSFFIWNGSTATIGIGTFIAAAVVILKFYKDKVGKPVYTLVLFHDLWKVAALALSISITVIIAPKVLIAANAALSAASAATAAKESSAATLTAVDQLRSSLQDQMQLANQLAALTSRSAELESERDALVDENKKMKNILAKLEGPLQIALFDFADSASKFSRGSVDRDELLRALLDDFRNYEWPPG